MDCYGLQLMRNEVEIFALQQFDYVECKMHWCTALLKDKTVISYALITPNIR